MFSFRQYLTEITQDIARDVNKWQGKLPFNDLFKQENRVVVPYHSDKTALAIKHKLDEMGMTPDFEKGLLGKDKRSIKIGKFIMNPKNGFSSEEQKWWSHNEIGNAQKALQAAYQADKYAIVISRHPIDVVRMSDHAGITSCHSQGGMYWSCAVTESQGQGAIAYLVRKDDLEDIDLDDEEIFADRKRNVTGIKPFARVRIRMFKHKHDGWDLAVPETRVYGEDKTGFQEQVRDWLYKNQKEKVGDRPSMAEFKLMGGSYQDTQAGDLFNAFFGDEEDSGEADYGGEDVYAGRAEQWDDELEDLRKEYDKQLKYSSVYASVEGDDGDAPTISMSADLYYRFPKEDFIQVPKNDFEYGKSIRHAFGGTDMRYLPGDFEEIVEDGENYVFRFTIPNESDVDGPDSVEEMYKHLLDLEKTEYPGAATRIRDKLTQIGYMVPHPTEELGKTGVGYRNFKFHIGKNGEMAVLMVKPVSIGNLRGRYYSTLSDSPAVSRLVKDWRGNIDLVKSPGFSSFYNVLGGRLKQLAGIITKFDPKQRFFPGMEEKIDKTWLEKILVPAITIKKDLEDNVYMNLGFGFHGVHTREQIQATEKYIKWLDDNMERLTQEAGLVFDTIVKPYYEMDNPRNI